MERRNFFAALAACVVAPFALLKARSEFDWNEFLKRDRKAHPPGSDDPNIVLGRGAVSTFDFHQESRWTAHTDMDGIHHKRGLDGKCTCKCGLDFRKGDGKL